MKKPRGGIVAGNWKMNLTQTEMGAFWSAFQKCSVAPHSKHPIGVFLYTPSVYFGECLSRAKHPRFGSVVIGAQNAHGAPKGAFTGELSAPMLQSVGVHHVLVGHSERRHVFGETDALIRDRTHGLLSQGMHVMLCIGETRAEREGNQTEARLTTQLDAVLGQGFKKEWLDRLSFAYEPVWAIGTGLTATPEQAEQTHTFIRKSLWDRLGMDVAGRLSIVYGGSVTPENTAALIACPNIDGLLVGGASLKAESFAAIISACA